MATITINRDHLRVEIKQKLATITPTNLVHKTTSVSYNAPIDKANAEVGKLKQQGFLVVKTYGDDWDCGQILRYALDPETQDEVIDQHITQIMSCAWSPAIRNGDDLLLVEDGNVYDPMNYDWDKYRYGTKTDRVHIR